MVFITSLKMELCSIIWLGALWYELHLMSRGWVLCCEEGWSVICGYCEEERKLLYGSSLPVEKWSWLSSCFVGTLRHNMGPALLQDKLLLDGLGCVHTL